MAFYNFTPEDIAKHPECEHIGLVFAHVKRHWRSYFKHYAIDFDDLMQIGYMALRKAYYKYDPTLGNTIQSYIYSSLKSEIAMMVRRAMAFVHIPDNLLFECQRTLSRGEPTERFKALLLSSDKLNTNFKAAMAAVELCNNRLTNKQMAARQMQTKSKKVYRSNHTFEGIDNADLVEYALSFVRKDKRKLIVTLHYGLLDGIDYPLAVIGKSLGCTREAVRQQKDQAINSMRFGLKRYLGLKSEN